jgi:lysozyme family protein
MANVDTAIDYTLSFEDSTLSGVITTAKDGKRTRFGVDEHYHPDLVACGFYSDMGKIAALTIARNVYTQSYAAPLSIAEIGNQEIANKLLSLGVNIGVGNAAMMLQLALRVPCDGSIGPKTLFALVNANPAQVIESIDDQAIAHYHDEVAKDPSKKKYLNGWLTRAEAV